ncbi:MULTISPECIES: hypothetical protein [unclassified Cryobacterium]|uniref:hypothetical protein n=1 Tax=unclassified Cryobacterium TaxID=2649013 RepID=UPI002AB3A441|nr:MULTISPECIES: hypothetical protein [unclassified Cryobacterium]MDY7542584.1 hypothetical protein [Cryobacterium sp. 5B3]MEB0264704.1 hypothetical protein [Cryobacterium sp. 10I5]MEB0273676.1 hypothetical protein [Cryobacterium sp. 5B3]
MTFFTDKPTPPRDPKGPASKVDRNPFEVLLSVGGVIALIGGIILSSVGNSIYASADRVSAYTNALAGNSFDTPNSWGLQLSAFGNQLSTVGLVILIGMAFYGMVRWNQIRSR